MLKYEIAWLKKYFPTAKPVKIHVVPYKRYFGTTTETDTDFVIKIAKRLGWETGVDTLFHEWAHCLTFATHPDHSDAWARAYGRITRKWHNE